MLNQKFIVCVINSTFDGFEYHPIDMGVNYSRIPLFDSYEEARTFCSKMIREINKNRLYFMEKGTVVEIDIPMYNKLTDLSNQIFKQLHNQHKVAELREKMKNFFGSYINDSGQIVEVI